MKILEPVRIWRIFRLLRIGTFRLESHFQDSLQNCFASLLDLFLRCTGQILLQDLINIHVVPFHGFPTSFSEHIDSFSRARARLSVAATAFRRLAQHARNFGVRVTMVGP